MYAQVPVTITGNKTIATQWVVGPDTLMMGGFEIVVAKYTSQGSWNAANLSFTGAEGIGWVQSNALVSESFANQIWPANTILRARSVKVVDSVLDNKTEITEKDAALLGFKATKSQSIELMVPQNGNDEISLTRYVAVMGFNTKQNGILVKFNALNIKVKKAGATSGSVLQGTAQYPSDSLLTGRTFLLNAAPGFTLEVSNMLFTTDPTASATALLHLPSSLSGSATCGSSSLNLGLINLSAATEFYKQLPDSDYGILGVGSTMLNIGGHGFVADFSSSKSYLAGQATNWKGIVLLKGTSAGTPSGKVISNTGYTQAPYSFTNAIITGTGLSANLTCATPYVFNAAQPMGYKIMLTNANLQLLNSRVHQGTVTADIELPLTAVTLANNQKVVLGQGKLLIDSNMNMLGAATIPAGQGLYWGDLINTAGSSRKSFGVEGMNEDAILFFSASPQPQFFPLNSTNSAFVPGLIYNNLPAQVSSLHMQGATFINPALLAINTPDISANWQPNQPNNRGTVSFNLSYYDKEIHWINVSTQGVNCYLHSVIANASHIIPLGDTTNPAYSGTSPFTAIISATPIANPTVLLPQDTTHSILLECVESAVYACNFSAYIHLPMPSNTTLPFKNMVFTSTANIVGGHVTVSANDTLAYWGLAMLPKPGFSSAGLVSVKTGQIIISAAGLAEKRHFTLPFWLNWGEMLANGNMGRLFFNYNSGSTANGVIGQQFDGFSFATSAVSLSPYIPDSIAYLHVAGTGYFPFFGGSYLNLKDAYNVKAPFNNAPFNNRIISFGPSGNNGFTPTNRQINGRWMDTVAVFDAVITYNDSTQDGFTGTGTASVVNFITDATGLPATVQLTSRGTCIRIGNNLSKEASLTLGPIANVTAMAGIWGCVCIQNNDIVDIVIQSQLIFASNVSIVARGGDYASSTIQITPSYIKFTVDGQVTMSVLLSSDVEVNGHMQLMINWGQQYIEGEIDANISSEQSSLLSEGSIAGQGQLNWHFGLDYDEIEGMIAVQIMAYNFPSASGAAAQGSFYIGKQAPKANAWVLVGSDPRFGLNMDPLPDHLTGIYGSVYTKIGTGNFLLSGNVELYVGLGAFVLTPDIAAKYGALLPIVGTDYVIGNLGIALNGEILGGLVSASAYADMQLMAPYPFSFQGKVGLKGCVLWVLCATEDLTIGLNTSQGFYLN